MPIDDRMTFGRDLLPLEPITVTIPDALRISGLGRTKLYELISNGELESVTVGTRRLIVLASLKRRLTCNRKEA